MGITLITGLTIQNRGDEIECLAGGPDPDTGKYLGWIYLNESGRIPRPLLNTEPIYGTEGEAVEAMTKIVADVPKVDLMK